MGLDMYLLKQEGKKKKLKEIGYWRKANHIHHWFVDNVQKGVDDCGIYVVHPVQLIDLLELCCKVLFPKKSNINFANYISALRDGAVVQAENLYGAIKAQCLALSNRIETLIEEHPYTDFMKEFSKQRKAAAKYLPTSLGFFFGSQEYDDWYMCNTISAVNILHEAIIDCLEHPTHVVKYEASW